MKNLTSLYTRCDLIRVNTFFLLKVYQVYAIDVLISTGEGLGREKDAKITIYKKTEDSYMLKMKTSREFYSKVGKQFGSMPFNIRNMEDEKKARMGVVECVSKRLIEPFQVLFEKEGKTSIMDLGCFHYKINSPRFLCCSVQVHSITDAQWTS